MTGDISDAGWREISKSGSHRTPHNQQSLVIRTIAVGGAAVCIGLVAEMNPPDADALSILLPAGNGNATQINILEGNVFNPQFGGGGNGNAATTRLSGTFSAGHANNSDEGTSGGFFGPIALGGAKGNGNVTQINILSYNIINPQFSINGGNVSNNKTVNNVAVGNGNNSKNEVTSDASSGVTLFGGAIGNGNTTQLSFFSGNIFNPQFSLFGDNTSNNTAITNVSFFNGNWSQNSVTSGGGFGTTLFGATTGNGNTNQFAAFTSNIFNSQFSFLGKNQSTNNSTTNLAANNGNHSTNSVGSTGGLGNNTVVGGVNGNGNTQQTATSSGNIINGQVSQGTWLPGMPLPIPEEPIVPVVAEQPNIVVAGSNTAGTSQPRRPLRNLFSRIRTALNGAPVVAPPAAAPAPAPAPATRTRTRTRRHRHTGTSSA